MNRVATRISLVSIACMAAVALGACNITTGNVPVPAGTPAPAPSKVKQLVLQGCGYVPTLESIAGIISASPIVPAAGAVADAICQAVTTIPFADGPGDHLPRVNNIIVKGYFTKARLK